MPNYTPNYHLTQPTTSERYDVAVQNGNMTIIDQQLKTQSDAISSLSDAIPLKSGIVDVNNCTSLKQIMDAIDASPSLTGECGTGNQESTAVKSVIGGTGLSNYDRCSITRIHRYHYLCIATSAVNPSGAKLKILKRAGNAPSAEERMSQTQWQTWNIQT